MNVSRRIMIAALVLLAGCSSERQSVNTHHRIVFFGDSITELGVRSGGYVTLIRDSLVSLGHSAEVIGAGISGNKVGDLLARLQRDVLSRDPSVVVIYIGINDVWHYEFASRGLSGTPKEEFRSGLWTLIDRIRSAGASVILCTPTVIGERSDGTNKYDPMLDDYSAVSREIAAETGATLCDLRTAFLETLRTHNPVQREKDILTYDGVHLNDAGNRLVASMIFSSLDGLALFFPQK